MLLKTRFYLPPLRANGVIRARLFDPLCDARGGSLTLISAPAGYGKTTLVSQWLHNHPHQFCWLTLGSEHNLPQEFWRYVIGSLQQVQPEVGRHAVILLQQVSDPELYRQCLVSLLNDLDSLVEMNRSDQALTLVLDDFHLIDNRLLLEQFNLLLDHLPPSLRVVLIARDQPQLNLSRRRASGQLLQLGPEELRFSEQETQRFFQQTADWQGDQGTLNLFCRQTEGWIAGLQLLALSLKQGDSNQQNRLTERHLDRHISDYLFEEVFCVQTGEVQAFLTSTALPKRFCAGLCNAITGYSDSARRITELERSDLFVVPLDNHRTWYRYHDLFRQFLLQQITRENEDQLDDLVGSTVGWLEENGYYDDAVELCLAQGHLQEARRLLNSDFLMQSAESGSEKYRYWRLRLSSQIDGATALPESQPLQSDDAEKTSGEPLTRREKAVLSLIAEGLSNKEIASQLHISLNTLKVHIRNLYGKMGVENRTQALLKLNR